MDPLLKSVKELPGKVLGLPLPLRIVVFGGAAALLVALGLMSSLASSAENYQYAFTNLTAEDSSEAAGTLKVSGIPFRIEANGAALAVPASKVHDARLLLAASGLPRGGGVGFELFDRGDLGVSEFTQRVNLRRANEGELARTIGRLAGVRSARVHLTMGEKGLYRDEDRKPSAAIVVNLQPGRSLGDRELLGIRHLASSVVPGLSADQVTVVDGKGAVLAADSGVGQAGAQKQLEIEREMEARIVSLLEPAVGAGAVIAKVTAAIDSSEVQSQEEKFDPDSSVLRSERKVASQQQQQDHTAQGGVAGAAANQPLQQPSAGTGVQGGKGSNATSEDAVRNFEISRVTTTTVQRAPRLRRLSIAVMVDGVNGKPRSDGEVNHFGELAKRAVGFDPARGDVLEISSQVFSRAAAETPVAPVPPTVIERARNVAPFAIGGVIALALMVIALRRRPARAAPAPRAPPLVLKPGARVADIEAQLASAADELPKVAAAPLGLPDPSVVTRDKAREFASQDPQRAAHLLKAWIQNDLETEARNG